MAEYAKHLGIAGRAVGAADAVTQQHCVFFAGVRVIDEIAGSSGFLAANTDSTVSYEGRLAN